MKITDVNVWLVRGIKYNWTLLKIYTDEGYTGVGEATNWPGSPIVFEAAKHVGQRIIGLDPMKTDFIWTKLYRDLNWIGPYGASLCAISGIDMALLDLKAKVLGVPCYELLGGAYRKDIQLYANYWFTGGGHNEADYAAQARRVMDAGFTGLKFDPFAHTNYFYGEDLASNLTLTAEQQDLAFNVSKAVREAVITTLIEWHDKFVSIIYVNEESPVSTFHITPSYIPSGFSQIESSGESTGRYYGQFQNSEGDWFSLRVLPVENSQVTSLDSEFSSYYSISFDNNQAIWGIMDDDSNTLLWESSTLSFQVRGNLSITELIKISEGIEIQ